jgi:hypothetical protein
MCLDMLFKAKVKIYKQWDARFLNVVHYPQWVTNVDVVSKTNGKIRVCVDHRDLKKASLKDDFSLPHK